MQERRSIEIMIGILAVIAVIAAMSVVGSIVAPVTCAVFLIAVVWPLQRVLQARMPTALAVLLTMVATLVAVGLVASLMAWGFGRVGSWVIGNGARLQEVYLQQTDWLESRGIGAAALVAEHFDMRWIVRAAQQLAGGIQGFLRFTLIMLVFTLLGLLEVTPLTGRIARLRNAERGAAIMRTGALIARKLQVYMLVRTVMSALTGIGIWAFARVTGLDLAIEWGVIAFALNYIPFIGPLIATVFPTLFAGLQFGDWGMAVTVFLGMNVIQFVLGSYLEPRMTGAVLSVSPFAVLFAVFFWALIWGIAGAFIGTPILIAALTICAQSPSTRWIAVLLSGDDGAQAEQMARRAA